LGSQARTTQEPTQPRLLASQPFALTQGAAGGPCPSGAVPPFQPQVISGTNNAGGAYSPFYLRILRDDRNRKSRARRSARSTSGPS
jgi:hypothetical protein